MYAKILDSFLSDLVAAWSDDPRAKIVTMIILMDWSLNTTPIDQHNCSQYKSATRFYGYVGMLDS